MFDLYLGGYMFNILVVDDEPEIVEVISEILEDNLDCKVKAAKNGLDAYHLAENSKFDMNVTGVYKNIPVNNAFNDLNYIIPWKQYIISQEQMIATAEMASGIAHDFNNILSIIYEQTLSIEEEVSASEKLLEKCRSIQNQSLLGASLTDQLLEFSYQKISEKRLSRFSTSGLLTGGKPSKSAGFLRGC